MILFSENLEIEYNRIKTIKDSKIQDLIKEHTDEANNLHNFNWVFGQFLNVCLLSYPLFSSQRELPFTMFTPFIDKLSTPTYHLIYAYQILITCFGCSMYVPLTTFFTTASIFALLQIKTLHQMIINVKQDGDTNDIINEKLNKYIKMHEKIVFYVKQLNNFVAYMCLSELLWFGFILSALLILLNIVSIYNIFS